MLKIKRLNVNPSHPCLWMALNDVQIICDCESILADEEFPTLDKDIVTGLFDGADSIEWGMVDAILVSNSYSLVMLPYITELQSFRGKVLTPAPVLRFGKVLIDDFFNETRLLSSSVSASGKNRFPNCGQWMLRYTQEQAANSLSKIQTLAYHEFVNLFGLLKVKCVSAGYEIGSCNWILKTDSEKLAYISRSSLYPSFAMPMDFSEFADVDVIILGSVNTSKSLPIEKAIEKFKTVTAQTLGRGGHALVPTLPSGLIYYLLENVAAAKEEFSGNLNPAFNAPSSSSATSTGPNNENEAPKGGVSLMGKVAKCPCLFISSQAKASLAYANASGEWLAPDRESALYAADSPFAFNSWIRNGHLATLPSLHSTPGQQGGDVEGGLWPPFPAVFLTGHPSCRLGAAVHLIRALSLGGSVNQKKHSSNALILVQSDEFLPSVEWSPVEQLSYTIEPFKPSLKKENSGDSEEEASSMPVTSVGPELTAYWLPLRFDISLDQLPTLFEKCGMPKQALILPQEVTNPEAILPVKKTADVSVYQIAFEQCLDVQLKEAALLPVHVDPDFLVHSAFPLTLGKPLASKDPRRNRDQRDSPQPVQSHVALIDGRLCFRDGKYRLESLDGDALKRGSEKTSVGRSTSPTPSPKPPGSPQSGEKSKVVVGGAHMLIAKSPINAGQLVKQLTESGVTGAQVITEPKVLANFLATQLTPHLPVLSRLQPDPAKCALVVFVSVADRFCNWWLSSSVFLVYTPSVTPLPILAQLDHYNPTDGEREPRLLPG
uniref:Lactamase_B domain-containing protein n=1 Tax=Mesocestoides corti TaxID=53468 RepID=A0A5K3EYH1_MESCO